MIVDFGIPFHWGEGLRYEGTWVSITIDVELCKDCTRCIFQCITFDLKGLCLIWHHEDRFFSEVFLHFVEGLLSGIVPNKGLVFLEEFVHRLGKFGEFPNEVSIKVSESKERMHLLYILGDWPVMDSVEFGGVHHHLAFFNNKAKIFDLRFANFAFRWFEVEVSFSEAFKNTFGEAFEVFFVLGENEDVVHVYDAKSLFNFIFEGVVHYCLKC